MIRTLGTLILSSSLLVLTGCTSGGLAVATDGNAYYVPDFSKCSKYETYEYEGQPYIMCYDKNGTFNGTLFALSQQEVAQVQYQQAVNQANIERNLAALNNSIQQNNAQIRANNAQIASALSQSMAKSNNVYVPQLNSNKRSYINNPSVYRGYSGNKYQYDLNDVYQRNQYGIDVDAQMRDIYNSNDVNSYLDKGMGQNGGGSYGDINF